MRGFRVICGTRCPYLPKPSRSCFLTQVHGTKNGALPISLEKRPCGKKVTLIANVTNPKALIFELKGR